MAEGKIVPYLRLGVNIDHVATIRNARGGKFPDPIRAAHLAVEAGADGITAHLREDRRHISDEDIDLLAAGIGGKPLNLEMAATEEMLEIALRHKPHAVCLVPERREERTTEGGLDAAGGHNHLAPIIRQLVSAKIRVSLFIEAQPAQIQAAKKLGAQVVEIHTGAYCDAQAHEDFALRDKFLERIKAGAKDAASLGLEVHAGHGLTFDTVKPIAVIPQIVELNIGHFLVGEAIFIGLEASIRRMRHLMDEARQGVTVG
jgi:pyridoxine 5-phosphate synthase